MLYLVRILTESDGNGTNDKLYNIVEYFPVIKFILTVSLAVALDV